MFYDDILVYSRTTKKYEGHLDLVFQILYDNWLHINSKKYAFGVQQSVYLGYIIFTIRVTVDFNNGSYPMLALPDQSLLIERVP